MLLDLESAARHYRDFSVSINKPTHRSERLHLATTDDEAINVAPVARLDVNLGLMVTGTARIHLTDVGDYGGHQFTTGVSPTGGTGSRSVAVPYGTLALNLRRARQLVPTRAATNRMTGRIVEPALCRSRACE
jgi:hypothetical protein